MGNRKQHQRTLGVVAALALASLYLASEPLSSPSDDRRSLRALASDPKSVEVRAVRDSIVAPRGAVAKAVHRMQGAHVVAAALPETREVESGWDDSALKLYDTYVRQHGRFVTPDDNRGIETHRWQGGGGAGGGEFTVFKERMKIYQNFWDDAASGRWEKSTYEIFDKYINPGETTVVDFGTWIGPTLLYHGQFSKRSIGIEADPVAFAAVEGNVELNRLRSRPWASRTTVSAGCVSRPSDVGHLTMRAAAKAGLSMSGIGDHVQLAENKDVISWQVSCYTLPDLFENYWNIPKPYTDVFVKIDIESYECKLVPSFHEWLKDEAYLPKMYISFHPTIEACTDEEYEGILNFFRLYDHVRIEDEDEVDVRNVGIDAFKMDHGYTVVLYQDLREPAMAIQQLEDEAANAAQQQQQLLGHPVKVKSGWDESGQALYVDRIRRLRRYVRPDDNDGVDLLQWPEGGEFRVLKEKGLYGTFWEEATTGKWEPDTFDIFRKYVNPGATTVVDFGTWIGPTLLFHGQYSLRSFGIEADPVAYATVEGNVGLNKLRQYPWAQTVSVDSGCVARPEDVGQLTMKAGSKPGHSMSGLGEHVAFEKEDAISWQVQCYTLPDLFENYWGIHRPYTDVFVKIDIESYECKLVPSFHEWLKEETNLPKMYISFHPHIQGCTDEEYEGVMNFFRLYDHVSIDDKEEVDIQNAGIEVFKKQNRFFTVVLHQGQLRNEQPQISAV